MQAAIQKGVSVKTKTETEARLAIIGAVIIVGMIVAAAGCLASLVAGGYAAPFIAAVGFLLVAAALWYGERLYS